MKACAVKVGYHAFGIKFRLSKQPVLKSNMVKSIPHFLFHDYSFQSD